jgi:aminoglycoside phosphotransferase (APT) family kinase protein
MTAGKMHENELDIDASLVSRLIGKQFPRWAHLPITPVPSAGTDNALYRLGDDMVARLPRVESSLDQGDKEWTWLPRLAPQLPLPIPLPLARGVPAEGYPCDWSIYSWLDGENATLDRIDDPHQLALDLARFISALQQIDPTEGPPAGRHNFYRGVPLAQRDASTREALIACRGMIDTDAAAAIWDESLETPVWDGPPRWVHGDIQSGNLLAVNGRLSAVIDFGGLGVGDPAVDLIVAWNHLPAGTRLRFREALDVDDATWARGRGWALSVSLIALPYYVVTNPTLAGISHYAIAEVLDDEASG